ncbi:MAG TPA: hypothetical protein VL485_13670 [Ktedonobacteraceae bacterium]|nr:hypothetical protein [Ktedonobacteraceae bacterium]
MNAMRSMPQERQSHGCRNFFLILLVGALIISVVFVSADFLKGRTILNVQVGDQQAAQIDLNQSFAISPYLLGSNVFPRAGTNSQDQAKSGFMSYDQQVIRDLNSAHIKLLRFPGGNWGEVHVPSTTQLNDFSNLLNQVNAEGMMQVPLSDPLDVTPVSLQTRASRAALLVDYMDNRQSIQRTDPNAPFHPITYWTIGNEPDLLTNPDTRRTYTAKNYAQTFITYSLAMHQKDPNIKIFGPEISQYAGKTGPRDATGKLWMDEFITEVSAYARTHSLPFHILDGISFHRYPFGDAQAPANALLNSPAQTTQVLPSLRQLIRQQFGTDLPIAITEINTNSQKNEPPQNLAAVWWASTLGELMNNQVELVAFFSTQGVDLPYPLLTQHLTETAMLRVMQLFAQLQPELVPIPEVQGPVNIYATQDQEHTTASLLLVNTTPDSQVVHVQAASTLPLSPWQNTSLTLPAYGMAVLTIHRNASSEAFHFNNVENAQQDAPELQHLVCQKNSDNTEAC